MNISPMDGIVIIMIDRIILTMPAAMLNALFHPCRALSTVPSIILETPSNNRPKAIKAINITVAAKGKTIAATPIAITIIPKPISINFLLPLTNEIVAFSNPTMISTEDRIITNETVAIVGNTKTAPANIMAMSPRII